MKRQSIAFMSIILNFNRKYNKTLHIHDMQNEKSTKIYCFGAKYSKIETKNIEYYGCLLYNETIKVLV